MLINVNLQNTLVFWGQISLFPPVIIGLIRKSYSLKLTQLIFYLLICYVIFESISSYYTYNNQNNIFIFFIGTFVEFTILSVFYYKVLNSKRIKIIIPIGYALFMIALVLDFQNNHLLSFNTYSLSIESLLLTLYALLTFYEILINSEQDIFANPLFWINSAFLIYYSGNLLVFLFNNYLYQTEHVHPKIWMINSILNIIYYIPISIGFWKNKATLI